MKLRKLEEFFPSGTQMKTPSGVSINIDSIIGIMTKCGPEGYLKIWLRGFLDPICCTFHRNIDGSPAKIYEIAQNLRNEANLR